MKKLKKFCKKLKFNFFCFLLIVFISTQSASNEIKFEIKGNNYTDRDVILSLLTNLPESINKEYAKILKYGYEQ